MTGCLPRNDLCGAVFPIFGESVDVEIYPRSDWPDIVEQNADLSMLVGGIKNQGREGTCASQATAQAIEICWNLSFGKRRWVPFSPISIYKEVSPGPNSGSNIGDNMRQLRDVGCLPLNTGANAELLRRMGLPADHVMPATGYYTRYPRSWKSTAAFFRGVEFYDVASFDELVSALLQNFPVVYGRAGHAICGVNVVRESSVWHVKYANSWGNWGENGFGYDSERYISRAIASYGAFAVRAVFTSDEFLEASGLNWAA